MSDENEINLIKASNNSKSKSKRGKLNGTRAKAITQTTISTLHLVQQQSQAAMTNDM